MKIKKLHIKNFKSIADLEIIEPNPFTVFVGPNGSGKSNIFEALEYARLHSRPSPRYLNIDIEKTFGDNGEYIAFNNNNDFPIVIEFSFDALDFGFVRLKNSLEMSEKTSEVITKNLLSELLNELISEQKINSKESVLLKKRAEKRISDLSIDKFLGLDSEYIYRLISINDYLKQNLDLSINEITPKILSNIILNQIPDFDSQEYNQFIFHFSRIFPYHLDRTNYKYYLRSDASNIDTILKKILLNDLKKEEILDWLRLFIPEFENIEIEKNLRGRNELRVYDKYSPIAKSKALISDGTFNILAILTAVFQSDEPQFLCIEEPENGLNPRVIKELVGFFRNACEEKGHYIWLNTHSQTLVSELTPDEIITVDKIKGETKIKQFKGEDFNGLSMDEAWLTNTLGGGLPW